MSIFFKFSGRLSRQPYIILWFALIGIYLTSLFFLSLLSAISMGGLAALGNSASLTAFSLLNSQLTVVLGVLMFIFLLLVFISTLSLCIRRLHDRDKSGWWLLIYIVSNFALGSAVVLLAGNGSVSFSIVLTVVQFLIGLWFLVELCFLRGTDGPNKYGRDQLGVGADANIFT